MIFKSNQKRLNEGLIEEGIKMDLKFTDEYGDHLTRCRLVQFGWGIDRRPIYYIFKILESGSKKYNKGADLYLGFDFNDRENTFIFHSNKKGCLESHYKSFIKII